MTWWQSLLIAIGPAIITAFISWIISFTQIRNTKKELKEKYDNENQLYIKKSQFDNEFNIYKELSEKTAVMVSDVVTNIFPTGLVFKHKDLNARKQYQVKIYNMCENSFYEAHKAINKYACFISKGWYERFVSIKQLCAVQLKSFFAYEINCPLNTGYDTNECYQRTIKIEEEVNKLIEDLRIYINELTKQEQRNAD